MTLSGFALRFKHLAFGLGLLALWVALASPMAVLTQEMRTGKWVGLCSGGSAGSTPSGQADEHTGHCALCLLPGLALPAQVQSAHLALAPAPAPLRVAVVTPDRLPHGQVRIRAPPALV